MWGNSLVRIYVCELYLLADISLKHERYVKGSSDENTSVARLHEVCLSRLCIQCRGHGRSCPSVTHTICMLLKSVAYTGLCWMLSSVIMSRHRAGRLFSLCGSRVCVCVRLYVLRDSCRSTVHSHILRRLTALRHKSSISCLQCLRFPVLNASPLGDIVILTFSLRTRAVSKTNLISSKNPPHFILLLNYYK